MKDLGFEDRHIVTRDLPFNFLACCNSTERLAKQFITTQMTHLIKMEAEKSGRNFKNEAHQRDLKDCITELVEALPDQWSLRD